MIINWYQSLLFLLLVFKIKPNKRVFTFLSWCIFHGREVHKHFNTYCMISIDVVTKEDTNRITFVSFNIQNVESLLVNRSTSNMNTVQHVQISSYKLKHMLMYETVTVTDIYIYIYIYIYIPLAILTSTTRMFVSSIDVPMLAKCAS
jgi:hypothetical protein